MGPILNPTIQQLISICIPSFKILADDYRTIRTSSQLYFNSFLPSVVREWNALPQACRNAISLESFKRSLNIDPTRKPPYYFIGDTAKLIMFD